MRVFSTIDEGWVWCFDESAPGQASGSRSAVAADGTVLCTYNFSSKLGVNDFCPMQARSRDGGITWGEYHPVWPDLKDKWSVAVNLSRGPDGRLFLFGIRTAIEEAGESFWDDETGSMKQNELVWASSADHGQTWSEMQVIPMPTPGAAEAPGALCITRGGRWLACYAPYNSFGSGDVVDRSKVLVLSSDDEGDSWQHAEMLSFPERRTGGAEAWVVELTDGRLVGASWKMDLDDRQDYENAFAVSEDGSIWQPTGSTGTMGQSVGLASTADGRVLMAYNQRKHGEPGVWLALARPTAADFGIEANEVVWKAKAATQAATSGDHGEWTDFAFGEPSVSVLPDGKLLVVFWVNQPDGSGVRYVRLRMN